MVNSSERKRFAGFASRGPVFAGARVGTVKMKRASALGGRAPRRAAPLGARCNIVSRMNAKWKDGPAVGERGKSCLRSTVRYN
jgi:hypothetical protein